MEFIYILIKKMERINNDNFIICGICGEMTINEERCQNCHSILLIRRNGNMYYRELQCTGLITAYMDANARLFISDAELYKK